MSKDELSAESLINKYLKTFKKKSKYHSILKAYHFILDERRRMKRGKFRSVRLALTPAVQLLSLSQENSSFPPNQVELNHYLNNTPGQKSAITGFVNFLNYFYSLKLKIEIKKTKQSKINAKRKICEVRLLKMKCITPSNVDDWITSCLELFYTKEVLKIKKYKKVVHMAENGGLIIQIQDKIFWIPSSLV